MTLGASKCYRSGGRCFKGHVLVWSGCACQQDICIIEFDVFKGGIVLKDLSVWSDQIRI